MQNNNDRFAVLCNRHFSVCKWRVIWCHFVAEVKDNPGGFQMALEYIDGHMLSILELTTLCASWQ